MRPSGPTRSGQRLDRLHLSGVVLSVQAASFAPGVLDAGPVAGRIVVRERGEAAAADAVRLGHELAARMLALGAADLMRAGKTATGMMRMTEMEGWIAFVGAGPGDEGLLTIRATRLLGAAGLVVAERRGGGAGTAAARAR